MEIELNQFTVMLNMDGVKHKKSSTESEWASSSSATPAKCSLKKVKNLKKGIQPLVHVLSSLKELQWHSRSYMRPNCQSCNNEHSEEVWNSGTDIQNQMPQDPACCDWPWVNDSLWTQRLKRELLTLFQKTVFFSCIKDHFLLPARAVSPEAMSALGDTYLFPDQVPHFNHCCSVKPHLGWPCLSDVSGWNIRILLMFFPSCHLDTSPLGELEFKKKTYQLSLKWTVSSTEVAWILAGGAGCGQCTCFRPDCTLWSSREFQVSLRHWKWETEFSF